jgi:hypothetical protein
MLFDLPLREALVTWSVFAALGGALTVFYELWARRKWAGTGRAPRPLVQLGGLFMWPAMVPDAVGLMLNDLGVIPADERSETHEEDWKRITAEMPVVEVPVSGAPR